MKVAKVNRGLIWRG